MDTTKRKLAPGSGSGSGMSDDGRHQPLVLELNEIEDVTTYMSSSQPFILRSGVSHWPALTKWVGAEGKRYLSSLHGKQHVEVAIPSSSRDVTGRYTGDVREAHSMTVLFDDFLTGNVNHPDCGPYPGQVLERKNRANMYLAQCSLYSSSPEAPAMLPKLMEDVPKPHFISGELCSANLWMRIEDKSHSTLHYDAHHNVLCLVSGRKRISLYRPNDEILLNGLRPLHVPSCNHCSVEDSGSGQEVELLAGDCAFIPEGWFHKVDSDQETLAVNLWWPGLGSFMASSGMHAAGGCCRLVAPSWKSLPPPSALGVWGAGVQGGHLARRLFEGLLEEEKAVMRKEAAGGGGRALKWGGLKEEEEEEEEEGATRGSGKRKQPEGDGDGDGDGGDGSIATEMPEEYLKLRRMDGGSRLRALLDLVDLGQSRRQRSNDHGPLSRLFSGMDPLTVEILTHGWENCSVSDAEFQAKAFERLWGSFHDGGAEARKQLMAKKEEFAKIAMTRVVERVLGFRRDDPR